MFTVDVAAAAEAFSDFVHLVDYGALKIITPPASPLTQLPCLKQLRDHAVVELVRLEKVGKVQNR